MDLEEQKEHYRIYNKEYYEANKDKRKEYMKERRQTPEGRAAMKRKNHRD